MANIIDYIKWRGDLPFEDFPFNELDNAVFSLFSYLDLKDLQTRINTQSMSMATVCEYLINNGYHYGYMTEITAELLNTLRSSERFSKVMLFNYTDLYHEKKYQFSSTCFLYRSNHVYVAFRGTDDTVIAWKEDFMMSFEVVPAQKFALSFLEKIIGRHIGASFIVGGHSKGGNLALYACAMCSKSLQDRITAIYNNDGPDLCDKVIDVNVMNLIEDKLIKIVPEFCIVGMIFNSTENIKVVKANDIAFMQHDILNWNCIGTSFEEVSDVHKEAERVNHMLGRLLEGMDLSKRKEYVNKFFDKIIETGTTRLPWTKNNKTS